jgi:hypothetical protein
MARASEWSTPSGQRWIRRPITIPSRSRRKSFLAREASSAPGRGGGPPWRDWPKWTASAVDGAGTASSVVPSPARSDVAHASERQLPPFGRSALSCAGTGCASGRALPPGANIGIRRRPGPVVALLAAVSPRCGWTGATLLVALRERSGPGCFLPLPHPWAIWCWCVRAYRRARVVRPCSPSRRTRQWPRNEDS